MNVSKENSVLRLYKIDPPGSKTDPVYFSDKRKAKMYRDDLRDQGRDVIIMRGPDHRKGESFNVSKQTPRSLKSRR